MTQRPPGDGPPRDRWKIAQVAASTARLLLDLIKWFQDGGPGRLT
ncbi:hypothetical protein SMC26_40375 [Actinomadura fulvescens]